MTGPDINRMELRSLWFFKINLSSACELLTPHGAEIVDLVWL